MFKITVLCMLMSSVASTVDKLHFDVELSNVKKLSRFWTNTGFCPPAPTDNSTALAEFFLSEKTTRNLEYISAVPNNGLKSVRIHWLINLIEFVGIDDRDGFQYNFSKLDKLLDRLTEMRLYPVIEFMGNPSNRFFNQKHFSQTYLWRDLVYQMLSRYIHQNMRFVGNGVCQVTMQTRFVLERYGLSSIKKWKFETWNEPDLRQYNTLNYTLVDYEDYIYGVRRGLDDAGENNYRFLLYGPAGLFKNNETHQLCWGIIEKCNSNLSQCPFDILSYHRKGEGRATDVIDGSLDVLLNDIYIKFPKLKNLKISNSEADPTTGWSKPLPMNADVSYAVTLVNIVLLHWNAKYHNILPTLDSISHDNAFISYHPYEFYQRTLLALFQLNNTNPIEMQFIAKPVYAAIGMLGNLGSFGGDLNNNSETGTMALWTVSRRKESVFLCGIIAAEAKLMNDEWSVVDVNVTFNVTDYKYVETEKYVSLIEYLEGNVTDPVSLWKSFGKPPYPNAAERQIMRKSQGPHMLKTTNIHRNNSHLSLHFKTNIQQPWIISIRICGDLVPKPRQPKNLRIRKVSENEVVLFWTEKFTKSRCTKTFEIFFSPVHSHKKWIHLTANQHVPFMSYHFAPEVAKNETIRGRYKVRGVDVFDRRGKFSSIENY